MARGRTEDGNRTAALGYRPAFAILDPAQTLGEVSLQLGDGNGLLGHVHETSLVTKRVVVNLTWGKGRFPPLPGDGSADGRGDWGVRVSYRCSTGTNGRSVAPV